ncbi:8-oxo-dGTP diphosphatase [Streptohalobacillus salinus]|uniref:8-oxo-dGTP diphosphatase n=1 Tax=Streptohalobacillus salinus TaxID=621096 RepID=A0A2V3WBL4_9BACI|nr:8-oxo-dGTP diphosphatase [Streptohalobacillus salinus]PXW91470.1 8-oxo-dGTP diphosphatase [Streptohalobacillus salinus]
MQRVTNCLVRQDNKVLLLKKPRHGWYAMPGGKMEDQESIAQAAIREVYEETGLKIEQPKLMSVATMNKAGALPPKDEWMMFTFVADKFTGELVDFCREGELEWIALDEIGKIPTAPTDAVIHDYLLKQNARVYARFDMDENEQIINQVIDIEK